MTRIFMLFLIAAIGVTGCNNGNHAGRAPSASQHVVAATPDADDPGQRTDQVKITATPTSEKIVENGSAGDAASAPHLNASLANGVPVETSVVRYAAVPITITATGTIIGGANSQASLAFPEAGRIAHVDVSVGETIVAGKTIAQLDTGPFAADAAQMRAALTAAQANYSKTASGARPQLVAQTNAQIQGAKTQLAVAQSNLARQQQLLRLGIASQVDVETAKTAVASAQSQLQVYQQQQSAQVQPLRRTSPQRAPVSHKRPLHCRRRNKRSLMRRLQRHSPASSSRGYTMTASRSIRRCRWCRSRRIPMRCLPLTSLLKTRNASTVETKPRSRHRARTTPRGAR